MKCSELAPAERRAAAPAPLAFLRTGDCWIKADKQMLPSPSEVEQRSESKSWVSGLIIGAGCAKGEKGLWAVKRKRRFSDLVLGQWEEQAGLALMGGHRVGHR